MRYNSVHIQHYSLLAVYNNAVESGSTVYQPHIHTHPHTQADSSTCVCLYISTLLLCLFHFVIAFVYVVFAVLCTLLFVYSLDADFCLRSSLRISSCYILLSLIYCFTYID